ncbi:hypothetical protein LWC08_02195 [Desulfobaculum bizertense]|uniref:hypothetical protein n=1 Tax=Desulfobaculum bizertense TaxID=376490 RepID=UPI001F347156|nr:hypothetical protein [Desulfobaculum bizertense]UIJ38398.1 hypothetical protein LWC08_02195 [Desulfobaculum bizertense]
MDENLSEKRQVGENRPRKPRQIRLKKARSHNHSPDSKGIETDADLDAPFTAGGHNHSPE